MTSGSSPWRRWAIRLKALMSQAAERACSRDGASRGQKSFGGRRGTAPVAAGGLRFLWFVRLAAAGRQEDGSARRRAAVPGGGRRGELPALRGHPVGAKGAAP